MEAVATQAGQSADAHDSSSHVVNPVEERSTTRAEPSRSRFDARRRGRIFRVPRRLHGMGTAVLDRDLSSSYKRKRRKSRQPPQPLERAGSLSSVVSASRDPSGAAVGAADVQLPHVVVVDTARDDGMAVPDIVDALERESSSESSPSSSFGPTSKTRWSPERRAAELEVVFSWDVFVYELVYHALQPLLVPYLWWRYGEAWVRNHYFWGHHWIFYQGTMSWVVVALVNVAYFAGWTEAVVLPEVIAVTTLYMIRSLAIAIKYAYFPPSEMERRMAGVLSHEEMGQSLLNVGWYMLPVHAIEYQLEQAVLRVGISLDEMFFTFHDRDEKQTRQSVAASVYAAFAGAQAISHQCPDHLQEGKVDVPLLVTEIIIDAAHSYHSPVWACAAVVISLTHCLIGIEKPEHWASMFDASVYVSYLLVSIQMLALDVFFLMVAIVDFLRRIFIMNQLSALLSERFQGLRLDMMRGLPTLDIEQRGSDNLYNWLACRLVLNEFGKQFFKRLQLYCSLLVVLMLSFIVTRVFLSLGGDWQLDGDEVARISFDATVLFVLLFTIVIYGKRLNTQRNEHRNILLKICLHLQRVLLLEVDRREEPERYESLWHALKTAHRVFQSVSTVDEHGPVRILGFKADNNFSRGLFTIASVAVALVLRRAFQ